MPPKKPATSTIVGEYDIELMTEHELRMYIEALREEHLRMRKARNLYHKDKNELLNILKFTQESITDREGIEIQKSIEIQKQLIQAENQNKFEDMLNKITELENRNKGEKDVLESFLNIKTSEFLNKEEENVLEKAITERNREIDDMEYTLKLLLIQLKENYFEKNHKSSNICQSRFEEFVINYIKNLNEITEEFSQNKIEQSHAILGDIPDTKSNPFIDGLTKMGMYFKDVYWKNIKTIRELQIILKYLKKELNTLMLHLCDITNENNQIRRDDYKPDSPLPPITNSTPFNSAKSKILEELIYENYLLTIKLKTLNKEYSDLKEKFIFALRRIYQNADFKALLLEFKISALQNYQENSH